MPDPDAGAGRAVDARPAASRSGSGRSRRCAGRRRRVAMLARRDLLGDPDRRPGVGDQRRPSRSRHRTGRQPAGVEAGRVPAVRLAGRRSCRSPISRSACRMAANAPCHSPSVTTRCSVPSAKPMHELGEELGRRAVVRAGPLGVEADEARSTTRRRASRRARSRPGGAARSRRRSGTAIRWCVVGPAGREDGVADPLAVQPRLVQAERGHVQPGRGHRLVHGELAAQVGRGAQRVGAPGRPGRAARRAESSRTGPSPIQRGAPASRPGPARPRTRRARSTPSALRSRPRPAPASCTGRRGPAAARRRRCRPMRRTRSGRCPRPLVVRPGVTTDLVGGLRPAAARRPASMPAEPDPVRGHAEGVVLVGAAQPGRGQRRSGVTVSGLLR